MPTLIMNPKLRGLTATALLLAVNLICAGLATAAHCTAPYVNVQGAGTTALNPELTIERVNIGEPFDGDCNKRSITFVEKVVTLDPGNTGTVTPLYNAVWTVRFSVPDTNGTSRRLFVVWNTTSNPTGTFSYGFEDTSTGQTVNRTFICAPPAITCPVTGTVLPNGTITIKLDTTLALTFTPQVGSAFSVNLGNAGTNLSSIQGITYICACAAGSGLISTQSQTVGDGSRTLAGSLSCSAPPIAALSATPTMGNATLTVNFNASGSNIPAGGCGTINSYIFDFGDSTGVTQATPTTSHPYTDAGTFPARVRVTSTVGLTSANIAEQVITVNSAQPPALSSVVSRLTHGGTTDFDVVLPQPPAPRNVECRSGGATNDYKMVFTFVNNLVSVASATVTGGAGSVLNSGLGPNTNQYTVNLTGVTNGQSTAVTLHNALDSIGASGDEPPAIIGVLIGDVNQSGRTDAGDVTLVRQQTPSTPASLPTWDFRRDVTTSARIDAGDVTLVRQHTPSVLPP
jgi:PKD repeat protein